MASPSNSGETERKFPVYNDRSRPGLGQNLAGQLYRNSFAITARNCEESGWAPYRLADFLKEWDDYHGRSICASCISARRVFSFHSTNGEIDRTAMDRKFGDNGVDESRYCYCPQIADILAQSDMRLHTVEQFTPAVAAASIPLCIGYWDNEFYLALERIGFPAEWACPILRAIWELAGTVAERTFLELWFMAVWKAMNQEAAAARVYFEETDFDPFSCRLFRFVFPIPQVWVQIIPRERMHSAAARDIEHAWNTAQPQRIDFLIIAARKLIAVEIDGPSHFSQGAANPREASERNYRDTLASTRQLQANGYTVYRFTNDEILDWKRGIIEGVSDPLEVFRELGLASSDILD